MPPGFEVSSVLRGFQHNVHSMMDRIHLLLNVPENAVPC